MAALQQIYDRKSPVSYKSSHGTVNIASNNLIVGLELEIEQFNDEKERSFGGFTFTTDGSLRDGGIEAITKPVNVSLVPPMLAAFFRHYEVKETNYSERCSTHVHVNMMDATTDQVAGFCLVYQTIERLLFGFVGHNRDKNIFCVPWYQSGLTYNLVQMIEGNPDHAFRRWQKYSALNLIPISSQGSVEFRHLYGTCDIEIITQWLKVITRMKEYALAMPLVHIKEIFLNMNTVSNYSTWLDEVFKEDAYILKKQDRYEEALSLGIVDTKMMLLTPVKTKINANTINWADRVEAEVYGRGAVHDGVHITSGAENNLWQNITRHPVFEEVVVPALDTQGLIRPTRMIRQTTNPAIQRVPTVEHAPPPRDRRREDELFRQAVAEVRRHREAGLQMQTPVMPAVIDDNEQEEF